MRQSTGEQGEAGTGEQGEAEHMREKQKEAEHGRAGRDRAWERKAEGGRAQESRGGRAQESRGGRAQESRGRPSTGEQRGRYFCNEKPVLAEVNHPFVIKNILTSTTVFFLKILSIC